MKLELSPITLLSFFMMEPRFSLASKIFFMKNLPDAGPNKIEKVICVRTFKL